MNLKNYYWYFTSALSKKTCKKIIDAGIKLPLEKAVIDKDTKNLKKRNSNISWINDKWIYDIIFPFIENANKNAEWNFQYDWAESCQFTKYEKKQHYGWHCDSFKTPYNNPENLNFNNKIRKLSITISLSDPKDYKGGIFEFDFKDKEKSNIVKCKEILPQGSIVVFPSHVWHRITPVTKGTRYSLVTWILGFPFK
jgi:PKHD-type hydroxylase